MKIQVYGPGCANCKTLEQRARRAVEELGVAAEFEKVTAIDAMIAAGIVRTPGLAIDGELKVRSSRHPGSGDLADDQRAGRGVREEDRRAFAGMHHRRRGAVREVAAHEHVGPVVPRRHRGENDAAAGTRPLDCTFDPAFHVVGNVWGNRTRGNREKRLLVVHASEAAVGSGSFDAGRRRLLPNAFACSASKRSNSVTALPS